jgi:hypothetical protein
MDASALSRSRTSSSAASRSTVAGSSSTPTSCLYRGSDVDYADFSEGDRATSQVLLNTFTEFGWSASSAGISRSST